MIPSFLLQKENIQFRDTPTRKRMSFIDTTIRSAASFASSTFMQWQSAKKEGFFQSVDSRIKVVFLVFFVVLAGLTHSIQLQIITFGLVLLLCIFSKLSLVHIYKRVFVLGFVFGFLLFLPASLNLFTKGTNAFTIVRFSQPHSWWIYNLPTEISVTNEGIQTVVRLTLKVLNSISVVLLVIYTTSFERIVKSLSFFKVPHIFLLTLTLTYKFIFILSNAIVETYQAIKMRWWNRTSVLEAEEIVAGRIGYLFRKSWERYELVYLSMLARGFNGKVNFCYFDRLKLKDYLFLTGSLLVFGFLIVINYVHARII